MMERHSISILIWLAGGLWSVAANAGEPAHPCATQADPTARLACYDRAFPPAAGAADATPVEARERESTGAVREQAVREFGLSAEQRRARDPEGAREARIERIQATVVGIDERSNGQRVVRLDNGQTWLLTEATSRGQLRPGDAIHIRNAALGTFMLVTPARVALRARRLN